MKRLLDEYKKTAKYTRQMKKRVDAQVKECAADIESLRKEFTLFKRQQDESAEGQAREAELQERYSELRLKEKELKKEQEIVNRMVSSIAYTIHWLRYNTEPPNVRNVERRAYYEKEIPFENQWIERRKNSAESNSSLVTSMEENECEKAEQDYYEELVKEIKKCLTPRQIEVMELVGMDFSATDIASMLGITKRAVNYIIVSSKKKVKEEGWRMV